MPQKRNHTLIKQLRRLDVSVVAIGTPLALSIHEAAADLIAVFVHET